MKSVQCTRPQQLHVCVCCYGGAAPGKPAQVADKGIPSHAVQEASRRSGKAVSTLQRMCRNHGIDKWPKKSSGKSARASMADSDGTTDDEQLELLMEKAAARSAAKEKAKGKGKAGADVGNSSNDTTEWPETEKPKQRPSSTRRRRPVQRDDAWLEDLDDEDEEQVGDRGCEFANSMLGNVRVQKHTRLVAEMRE